MRFVNLFPAKSKPLYMVHYVFAIAVSVICLILMADVLQTAESVHSLVEKKYSLIDENGKIILKDKYLLSLKDFNASKSLQNLIKSGVKSFKIEGRLKDINYVKNVVAFIITNLINMLQELHQVRYF